MHDIISLIKSKHAVLNKRSSSLKPKSVTFKEENENELVSSGKKDDKLNHRSNNYNDDKNKLVSN
jgi:hypothetical protein